MRALCVLFLAAAATAGPHGNAPVPLRDLKPRFVRGPEKLLRSRTKEAAGLPVGGLKLRGLSSRGPFRVGYDVDGDFGRFKVRVAVLDGMRDPVIFRILGDGRPLAATPPLFAGSRPVQLEVSLEDVVLLELAVEGGARAAWLGGELWGAEGRDLGRFRATSEPFSPSAYPPSFRREVNTAIDRAVRHLTLNRRANGTWKSRYNTTGTTALVTLALLKAGVPGDDPGIAEAFNHMRTAKLDHVYTASCMLMALEARYFPKGANPREARKAIPKDDQVRIRQVAAWLAARQGAGFPEKQRAQHPVWRYPAGGYDLSNTQYALFGLSAAARCGVTFPRAWLPALRYILAAQEKEGPGVDVSRYFRAGEFMRRRRERAAARGFGYRINGRPTGSMTSAGLCSLILCRNALRGKTSPRSKTRAGIRDALAWLEEYYEIDENPFRGRTWWVYYLFNIERVGVLLDQRYLGTRDWYHEGAEALIAAQEPDGRIAGGTLNTAFALLFLKKATVSPLTRRR